MKKTGIPDEIRLMKPFMPPVGDLLPYMERIWESRQLTNGGPVHTELEKALCKHLGVKHICLFANGTLALMIALKALDLKGEVITTPFTSQATLQAIRWNHLEPVFADISEPDLNISPHAVEAAITSRTSAIVPVHLYGTPCAVEMIGTLARKHHLKVVYDAAHCFGVAIHGNSVCNFGDLSVLSFHATKVFSTIEGGAIVCHDEKTKKRIDALKNSRINPDCGVAGWGVNAKMNELQAAFGLCQLKYIDRVIAGRRRVTGNYRELLCTVKGIRTFPEHEGVTHNFSYFPVLVIPGEFGASRDELSDYLEDRNIATRKYFSPLVSDYAGFRECRTDGVPVAREAARNILCLPLFHDMTSKQVRTIVQLISRFQRENSTGL